MSKATDFFSTLVKDTIPRHVKTPANLAGAALGAGTGAALGWPGEDNDWKTTAMLGTLGGVGGLASGKALTSLIRKHPGIAAIIGVPTAATAYANTFGRSKIPTPDLPGDTLGTAAGAVAGGVGGLAAGNLLSDDPDAPGLSPQERQARASRAQRNAVLLGLLGAAGAGYAGNRLGSGQTLLPDLGTPSAT